MASSHGVTATTLPCVPTLSATDVAVHLERIEEQGYTPTRYIWIHTQAEPNFALHLEMAQRGVWIEYDAIGNPDGPSDERYIEMIQRLLDAGHAKILLSHDRGWYDPGTPARAPQPFTYLSETFLPKLRDAGMDDATITLLTHTNPFSAYAR